MVELFGRRKIFTTTANFDENNIVAELNKILSVHVLNMMEMEYLYWYRRGLQPILNRTKQVRPEINNKLTENHAAEIVAFKNGYFLTQPAFYVSRRDDSSVNDNVKKLNEYLYLSGKQQADNEVVDWFHTVGLGIVYLKANKDKDVPVKAYSLDPRSAFVVYSREPGNPPIMGVNIVISGKTDETTQAMFDVFTRDKVFRVSGGITGEIITDAPIVATAIAVEQVEDNTIGEIPIIEYQYENNRMGAFETVVPMLDAINAIQSNRVDGIEQFIQSLMVFYNCQLGDDENGDPITPSYIREAGAIFLKSIGQDKADLKILSEQLNQTQTQVLVDNLFEKMMNIAGVPMSTNTKASTSDNVGAVFLRSGWGAADTLARNTEDLFKKSNRLFDKVFIKILNAKTDIDINLSDFELNFARNEMDNLLVKTQGALNLKQLGFSPELAFAKSGVSSDPVADVENSRRYIDKVWGVSNDVVMVEETRDDDVGV